MTSTADLQMQIAVEEAQLSKMVYQHGQLAIRMDRAAATLETLRAELNCDTIRREYDPVKQINPIKMEIVNDQRSDAVIGEWEKRREGERR